jgi:hypothetical protein
MNTTLEVLNGWKEIAKHLGTSTRSAQRYERLAGLPVRRPTSRIKGAVLATKTELDAWVKASPLKDAFSLRPALPQGYSVALEAFKTSMAEQRRLRAAMMREREELHTAVELLRATLTAAQGDAVEDLEQASPGARSVSIKQRIM